MAKYTNVHMYKNELLNIKNLIIYIFILRFRPIRNTRWNNRHLTSRIKRKDL